MFRSSARTRLDAWTERERTRQHTDQAERNTCIGPTANGHDLLQSLITTLQNDGVFPANSSIKALKSSQSSMASTDLMLFSSQERRPPPDEHRLRDMHPAPDAFLPPPSAQIVQPDGSNESTGFGGMPNLQSIEDFDREHQYTPRPKLIPITANKSTGDQTTKFQHQCDAYQIKPVFTFEEVFKGAFTAQVQIGSESITIDQPQPNKRHAKEEVCKLALARMPVIEKMNVEKRGTKRKSSDTTHDVKPTPVADKSENWVGILHEYTAQHKLEPPTFEESRTIETPVQFGCCVTFGDRQTQFGADHEPFSTKQAAKATAAKEAVMYLRSQGKLRQTPIKAQKTGVTTTPTAQDHTGLTQSVQDVNIDAITPPSLAQQAHDLIAALGFTQPRWESKPSMSASGQPIPVGDAFHDMAAYFTEKDVRAEPRLEGPIGKVERVYGMKKAKEACCAKVLPLLGQIQCDRMLLDELASRAA